MFPETSIYIGDMTHDIRAAKKAGVIPIALSRGYHTVEILEAENPYVIWENLHPATEEF